jgi:hypothetical protein
LYEKSIKDNINLEWEELKFIIPSATVEATGKEGGILKIQLNNER